MSAVVSEYDPTSKELTTHKPILKLLFVVNDAPYFLAHWSSRAKAAAQVGFDVHVAVPQDEATREVQNQGFRVHLIPLDRKGVNPLHELKSIWALYRLYRLLRPALVHHVTLKPAIYGGIAAQMAGVPAVVNAVTGLGYAFVPRSVMAEIARKVLIIGYRIAVRKDNVRITVENSDDCELFIRERVAPLDRMRVIRGAGVDIEKFIPVPEPNSIPLVIFAARMLWEKGVGDFVEAARMLREQGIQARFALVGDVDCGNPSAVPAEQLKKWNESGFVEWWGKRTAMPAVFADSHIACLPSFYREGIPRVLIEAAASGRAIVTTDVPGCREIVRHGENGLLVPPRDPGALAAALRELLTDPGRRREMGRRGRERVEDRFTDAHVIEATLRVYDEILSRNHGVNARPH